MTRLNVYDTEAKTIENICETNDITEAELIEMLLDFIDMDDFKEEYNLQ